MKLYIFDFDDTMIDNFPMDYESFRSVVESAGYRMMSKEELRALRTKGALAKEIIKAVTPKQVDTLFTRRKELVMSSHFLEFAKVRPHIVQAFAKIKNAGHCICIATRRMNRKRIEQFLKQENLAQYITGMLCGDDVKGTPEEIKWEMYRQLVKKYDAKPNETIVIGNSESDLVPAKQLGMITVAVDGTYTKKETLDADIHTDFKALGKALIGDQA